MVEWIFKLIFITGAEDAYVVGPFATYDECVHQSLVSFEDVKRHWYRTGVQFSWGITECESQPVPPPRQRGDRT